MPHHQTRRVRLADLQPHPRQASYFAATSPAEDRQLRRSIEDHGQRDPIVVIGENDAGLPAFTIMDGHRRAEALEELGCVEADVLVRDDLARASADEVEREYLEYNVVRRQLDAVEKALLAVRLYELESGRKPGRLAPHEQRNARDRVGSMLGMRGRNVSRYIRLSRTPGAVQRAVRDRLLQLPVAEQVDGLRRREQELLAEEIMRIRGELQETPAYEGTEEPRANVAIPCEQLSPREQEHHIREAVDRFLDPDGVGDRSRLNWKRCVQGVQRLRNQLDHAEDELPRDVIAEKSNLLTELRDKLNEVLFVAACSDGADEP